MPRQMVSKYFNLIYDFVRRKSLRWLRIGSLKQFTAGSIQRCPTIMLWLPHLPLS